MALTLWSWGLKSAGPCRPFATKALVPDLLQKYRYLDPLHLDDADKEMVLG